MRAHHTKNKGDIGLTKVIADLTEKGYFVSLPISEHLPYDLIIDDGECLKKLQSKYRKSGIVNNKTYYSTKNGLFVNAYNGNDFDVYGIYIPSVDKCVYVPNFSEKRVSITIRFNLPKSNIPFHWWEDFKNPNIIELPSMRTLTDFGGEVKNKHLGLRKQNLNNRRVKERPTLEVLKHEIEEYGYVGTGKKYGVSDNAIRKWEQSMTSL